MSNDTVAVIAVHDLRPRIANALDLTERVRRAFHFVQDFWLSTDPDLRYNAALAAVLLETSDPDEKDRLERSARAVKAAVEMFARRPYDPAALEYPAGFEPLPLIAMWKEESGQ